MCSNSTNGFLPYGLKIPTPMPMLPVLGNMAQVSLQDFHRSQQLYDYNNRLQLALRGYSNLSTGLSPYHHAAGNPTDPFRQFYFFNKHDPRASFIHEEPKPSQSYIGLIAMAILSTPDKKMVLSDIYQWILDHYAYFRTRGPGWRNSIRHNLSLNDCFIKSGRSANGKGHYWAIHPANVEDFNKNDFRRRRAQRRVRKYLGLAVPDDDDSPSPSPSTTTPNTWEQEADDDAGARDTEGDSSANVSEDTLETSTGSKTSDKEDGSVDVDSTATNVDPVADQNRGSVQSLPTKRRLFDMDSLLAPDHKVRRIESPTNNTNNVSGIQTVRDLDLNVKSENALNSDDQEESKISSTDDVLSGQSSPELVSSAPPGRTFGQFPIQVSGMSPFVPSVRGLFWQDGSSAFQSTDTASGVSCIPNNNFSALLSSSACPSFVPRISYPASSIMNASNLVASSKRWQETLFRIVSQSYGSNTKSDAS